jgi:hypothetical protein
VKCNSGQPIVLCLPYFLSVSVLINSGSQAVTYSIRRCSVIQGHPGPFPNNTTCCGRLYRTSGSEKRARERVTTTYIILHDSGWCPYISSHSIFDIVLKLSSTYDDSMSPQTGDEPAPRCIFPQTTAKLAAVEPGNSRVAEQ